MKNILLPQRIQDRIKNLSPEGKRYLEGILKEFSVDHRSPSLDVLWGLDYERTPVGVRQFVEDPEYIGKSASGLHECWKRELEEVFEGGILLWILTGAIGTGKTTAAIIAQLYKIYQLSCLRDPATFYSLLSGSRIVFGIFNVTLSKADTGYDLLKHYIDESPYFRSYCPRRKRPDEPIFFTNKPIKVEMGSLAHHVLGEHIMGFTLDEANFFKAASNPEDRTKAHQIFNQAYARLASRFMGYRGKIPGLMCLISSRKTQSHFLETQIEKMERDEHHRAITRVTSFALWDVKPRELYSGERFEVLVGDDRIGSRFLEPEEIPSTGYSTVSIPVEYRPQFELDIEDALRDFAGVSTVGSRAFFPQRGYIYTCVDKGRVHPFTKAELDDVRVGEGTDVWDFLIPRLLFRIDRSHWVPITDPGTSRVAHVDIGLTHDSLGLAVAHPYTRNDGRVGVYYDLLLRVRAPLKGEINLGSVLRFFRELQRSGMMFSIITYDRFQSRHSVQILTEWGFVAKLLSVQIEQYRALKSCLYEGRVSFYEYQPAIEEIINLRKDPDGRRPNHPEGGSDDVVDAMAAVAWHCLGEESPLRKVVLPSTGKRFRPLFVRGVASEIPELS